MSDSVDMQQLEHGDADEHGEQIIDVVGLPERNFPSREASMLR